MISIIIPVYNQANKISKCLNSILNQTYKDYEVIIVNDGSTDHLQKILKNYLPQFPIPDSRFQLINQENKGAAAARNRGAEMARGEFIIFCDADVVMRPNMLEVMLDTLTIDGHASFCYSSFKWGKKTFRLWPFSGEKLRQMPYIHTTSLIRTKDFPDFDESIKRLQDWDLWLTMLGQGKTGVWTDQILFTVQTGGTMSNWLPSFAYKLLPFLPAVKKYKQAVEIIKRKHNCLNH